VSCMESEGHTFLSLHPPNDHHTEPQAVGGSDKKR
jgi:hypothetical protein